MAMIIEKFLISFEKITSLNNFRETKYVALSQVHLTGKARR